MAELLSGAHEYPVKASTISIKYFFQPQVLVVGLSTTGISGWRE
jgi:hypothetical protein